ncbi:MAG: xanthine dehydrogenase family protein subunit M [Desulfosarcina sp.]
MMPPFSHVRPQTLEEVIAHLGTGQAVIHAGGTDLLGCLRERILPVGKVVSLKGLADLRGVREIPGGGLRIGALTTITQIAEHPVIRKRFSALAQGAAEVASPPLRNQGTIGGNLCQKPRCWYYRGEFDCLRKGGGTCFAAEGENQFHCIFGSDDVCYIVHPSDTAPPLVALNAKIEIEGPNGRRTTEVEGFHVLPADDVRRETWLEPDEMVTAIVLPAPPSNWRSSYRKVRARRAWDFALAGVALALGLDGDRVAEGRVVLSGAAPVPWRSRAVEDAILGKRLDSRTIAAAADAVVAEAQPLEKNGYKIPLFRGVIEEELGKMAASAGT